MDPSSSLSNESESKRQRQWENGTRRTTEKDVRLKTQIGHARIIGETVRVLLHKVASHMGSLMRAELVKLIHRYEYNERNPSTSAILKTAYSAIADELVTLNNLNNTSIQYLLNATTDLVSSFSSDGDLLRHFSEHLMLIQQSKRTGEITKTYPIIELSPGTKGMLADQLDKIRTKELRKIPFVPPSPIVDDFLNLSPTATTSSSSSSNYPLSGLSNQATTPTDELPPFNTVFDMSVFENFDPFSVQPPLQCEMCERELREDTLTEHERTNIHTFSTICDECTLPQ